MRTTLLLASFLCLAASIPAAEKRLITESDLLKFQWAADPQISPDGSQVVYTHVKVNAKGDGYDTGLRMVSMAGGAIRELTAGPRDSGGKWSPDGRQLVFVRAPEKDGKPQPGQLFVLRMDGGEARALTDVPKGAGSPVWSPDGKHIAFHSTTLAKDWEKKKDGEEKSDVRVIARAAYRGNGLGYLDPERPSHIWSVEVPARLDGIPHATQVTSGDYAESDVQWSRDGSRIYFTSNRVREPYYQARDQDLYVVSASGGDVSKIASIDGPIHSITMSPDGFHIGFLGFLNGEPIRSFSQPDLFLTSVQPGSKPKNLTTAYDNDIGGGVGGDQHPPRGGAQTTPFWSKDGRFLFVVAAEEGRTNLKRIDVETGKVEAVTKGDHDVASYSASADGTRAALLISTPTNIGDLYALDVANGQMHRLTNINEKLFSELNLTAPEMFWYNSFDGKRIQTWVQKPPNFDSSKKYPMILNIHGGPHAAYGYTFDHEFQWMAAKGYVVVYPNPRGSTSYGQDFGNVIQFHYPGDDHKDLMAAVDQVIKLGWVDPDKLGV
ncbi:MAG: prolyl oligopeptidase family serine peptidase, partial [Bryobacteraceae bacterium]